MCLKLLIFLLFNTHIYTHICIHFVFSMSIYTSAFNLSKLAFLTGLMHSKYFYAFSFKSLYISILFSDYDFNCILLLILKFCFTPKVFK